MQFFQQREPMPNASRGSVVGAGGHAAAVDQELDCVRRRAAPTIGYIAYCLYIIYSSAPVEFIWVIKKRLASLSVDRLGQSIAAEP